MGPSLTRNTSYDQLKTNLMVFHDGPMQVDTLDLKEAATHHGMLEA